MFSLRRKTPLSVILAAIALIAGGPYSVAHTHWRDQWWRQGIYRSSRALTRSARHALHPLRDALPNPALTPGALNPVITQADIHQTICVRGYSRSIRPPERYTERLKRAQIRAYGYRDRWLRDYEEDHLIALSLGGSPTSPENLWPQPHEVVEGWGSYAKDRLEARLHWLVCHRGLALAVAQRALAHDWIAAYKRYIGPTPDNRRLHWNVD
jgi:hypothetical protein